VSELNAGKSKIFLNPLMPHHPQSELWTEMRRARTHGFPNPDKAVEKHPGEVSFHGDPEFVSLREGDTLPIGNMPFGVIETPATPRPHVPL